jgi:hypothetical protein
MKYCAGINYIALNKAIKLIYEYNDLYSTLEEYPGVLTFFAKKNPNDRSYEETELNILDLISDGKAFLLKNNFSVRIWHNRIGWVAEYCDFSSFESSFIMILDEMVPGNEIQPKYFESEFDGFVYLFDYIIDIKNK